MDSITTVWYSKKIMVKGFWNIASKKKSAAQKHSTDASDKIVEYFKERTIIIVDDRQVLRRTIKSMLRIMGINSMRIMEAGNGLEVIRILKRTEGEFFLLLDIYMPQMSGFEVMEVMAKDPRLKDTPVLIITADNHEDKIGQALENGSKGYIIKPFTEGTLREKLLNIIAPPSFLVKFQQVENFQREERYEEALDMIDEILKVKSESPGAYLLRGEIYEQMELPEEALAAYNRAHSLAPIFLRVIKKLGDYYLNHEQPAEALYFLELADKLNPHHTGRKMEIGQAYLKVRIPEQAETSFDKAYKLDNELDEEIAEICLNDHPPLAEKFFHKVLLRKKDVTTINQLGMALRAQGKWQEAVDQYKSALLIEPDNFGVYFNMGRAYSEGQMITKAVECFNRVLEIEPGLKEAEDELKKLQNTKGQKSDK